MKFLSPLVLVLIILSVGMCSANTPPGFIAGQDKITVYNIGSANSTIIVGDHVNVTMYVKNYANYALTNVTILQNLNISVALIESPLGTFNGTDVSYNATDNVSVIDQLTQTQIPLTEVKITATNFTMSFDSIPANTSYVFNYRINATEDGDGIIDNPRMTYLDNYLDEQTFKGSYNIKYTINPVPVYSENGYFPNVKVANIDNWKIGLLMAGIIVITVVSRMLYFQKPLDL